MGRGESVWRRSGSIRASLLLSSVTRAPGPRLLALLSGAGTAAAGAAGAAGAGVAGAGGAGGAGSRLLPLLSGAEGGGRCRRVTGAGPPPRALVAPVTWLTVLGLGVGLGLDPSSQVSRQGHFHEPIVTVQS